LHCEEQKDMKDKLTVKSLTTKVSLLEAQNKALREESVKFRAEIRDFRAKSKRKEDQVARLREKCKAKGTKVSKNLAQNGEATLDTKKRAEGYQYSLEMMQLCLTLCLFSGCSLRGVQRVLIAIQLSFNLQFEIPSKSTIDVWSQKLGLFVLERPDFQMLRGDYAIILDECMVIGSHRVLVILGIPACKVSADALGLDTVVLLLMESKPSWKAKQVRNAISRVAIKMGRKPKYGISDAGNNLKTGLKLAGIKRMYDVGHHLAKLLEYEYKNRPLFVQCVKTIGGLRNKLSMKDMSYLLPPKQRTVARFMNLSQTVEWAKKILKQMNTLTSEERKAYGCIVQYQPLIQELSDVFEVVNQILSILKCRGLGQKTHTECKNLLKKNASVMPNGLVKGIEQYLDDDLAKIDDSNAVWHVSSDAIESLFGKMKSKLSPNQLCGVTGNILKLSLFTMSEGAGDLDLQVIKEAMESKTCSELDDWKDAHLPDSQLVRRKNALRA
jgi:hypothetical protein